MDIGLVCDQCDAFNPMQSQTCTSCKSPLSLGNPRKSGPTPAARNSGGAPAARPSSGQISPSPRPRVSAPNVASVPPASGQIACPSCGTVLPASNRFCFNCGAATGPAGPPGAPAPSANMAAVPASPVPHSTPGDGVGGGGGGGGAKKTMFFSSLQTARAKLVLIKGDGLDGISFTLAGQDHYAGRGPDCPLLFKEDPFLSPVHADFFYRENKLHVRDEGSANGVFIRIRAPMPLRSGDTFLVGEQVLRVETTPPETAGLGPDDAGTYYYASPRRASRMRIVQLLRGGDVGLCYRATGDVVTLGRDGNDINFPEDPFISGRHAQVSFSDAGLTLTDTGSKNGTFLRLTGEHALAHGDYVFMGQQLLRVEIV